MERLPTLLQQESTEESCRCYKNGRYSEILVLLGVSLFIQNLDHSFYIEKKIIKKVLFLLYMHNKQRLLLKQTLPNQ